MLIGEAEILGQVKDAYVQAQRANSLGTTLHRLFREALAAGKTARSQTRIGGESVSIATAAIEAAKARLGTLARHVVVVVGAGKMGRTALQAPARRRRASRRSSRIARSRTRGARRPTSASARRSRCRRSSTRSRDADVVVTSTGASHFVLTQERRGERDVAPPRPPALHRDRYRRAARRRSGGRCDPERHRSSTSTGSDRVVDERLELRREAIPDVEEIIASYVERFVRWYHSRVAVPVIASLTQKAEAIRAAELERLLRALPGADRARTDARHRHDDDDRLEAAALGDLEDPREGDARSKPRRSRTRACSTSSSSSNLAERIAELSVIGSVALGRRRPGRSGPADVTGRRGAARCRRALLRRARKRRRRRLRAADRASASSSASAAAITRCRRARSKR